MEAARVVNEHKLAGERTAEERNEIIPSIAYNAVKYFDLRHSKDYIFSFDNILSLKGNTAVYLMYAYTRIRSVQRQRKILNAETCSTLTLATPQERTLALTVLRFPEILADTQKGLAPHLLCDYLFVLSQQFHGFYETCRIVDSE